MKMLKMLRQRRGYTQQEFAKICGLDWRLLSKYERGERQPKIVMLKMFAKALECSVDDLISDVGNSDIKPKIEDFDFDPDDSFHGFGIDEDDD